MLCTIYCVLSTTYQPYTVYYALCTIHCIYFTPYTGCLSHKKCPLISYVVVILAFQEPGRFGEFGSWKVSYFIPQLTIVSHLHVFRVV